MSKYLLSVDIEGITGVNSRDFSSEQGRFYQLGCRYMTLDTNAVIAGIIHADPSAEILVRDAHGAGATNLNLELLHKEARVVRGWEAEQNMLTGLDKSFSGVFLIGYHAGGQNTEAVLGHTFCSFIESVSVNDLVLSEAGLAAFYAGYYDVPVALISGDDKAIKEAKEQLGNEEIIGVAVKESYGRTCVNSLSLEMARALLEKNAADATTKLQKNQLTPFKLKSEPANVEVRFYDVGVRASIFENLSRLLKVDSGYKFDRKQRSLTFIARDVIEVMQKLNLLLFLSYGIRSM